MTVDWKYLFTSFDGRINRAKYWLAAAVVVAAWLLVLAVAYSILPEAPAMAIMAIAFIAVIYFSVAVGAKRLHDRDKSAWWLAFFYGAPPVLEGIGSAIGGMMLFSLAGFAISIWALVELGILRGTDAPNAYGPDPLGAQQADATMGSA